MRESLPAEEHDSMPCFNANSELDYNDLKGVLLEKCFEDRSKFESIALRINSTTDEDLHKY
jgi:hypothetical protein